MSFLSTFLAKIAGIKSTPSGLVENNDVTKGLSAVHQAGADCFLNLGIANCADVPALQSLGPADAKLAFLIDGGVHYWNATDVNSTGRASAVSGYWIPDKHITMTALVTGIASANDVPVNDGAGHVTWGTVSVPSLGWGNVTSKPFTNDATNPTTSGNLSVGGTASVTGNVAVNTNKFNITAASGNTAIAGTVNIAGATTLAGGISGNTSITGTLSASGDLAINTNKFTVSASSGNVVIAGTTTHTGAVTNSSTTHCVGTVTADGTINTVDLSASNNIGCIQITATNVVANSILGSATCTMTAQNEHVLGNVTWDGLPSYANNAAAVGGGLAVGRLYRNGDIVQIVH